MKKLLLVILLLASNAEANWTLPLWHVSAGSVSCADVTTAAIDTSDTTFIVVISTSFGVAPEITDSKSNEWTNLVYYNTTAAIGVRMVYTEPDSMEIGSGHTFTSDGECSSIFVAGFKGNDTTPFQIQNGNSSSSSAGLRPGPLGAIGTNKEIVFTGFASDGAIGSVNNGFTLIDTIAFSDGNHYAGGLAYKILTGQSNPDPTWVSVGTTVGSASNIAGFETDPNYPAPTSGLFLRKTFPSGGR